MVKGRTVLLVTLRGLAMAATLSATILTAIAHQKTVVFNIPVEARFQDTPASWVSVIANAASAAYSLFAIFIPPTSRLSRFVVPADMIIAMFLTGALGASGAIAYTGKTGNPKAGWLPVCEQVPVFCDQMLASLICAFVGVLLYATIALFSVSTAMNSLIAGLSKAPVAVPAPLRNGLSVLPTTSPRRI